MEEKKQYSALTIDRAAFLLLRVKKAFKRKKLQRKEREKNALLAASNLNNNQRASCAGFESSSLIRKKPPPLLRSRTLPAIIIPGIILQTQLGNYDNSQIKHIKEKLPSNHSSPRGSFGKGDFDQSDLQKERKINQYEFGKIEEDSIWLKVPGSALGKIINKNVPTKTPTASTSSGLGSTSTSTTIDSTTFINESANMRKGIERRHTLNNYLMRSGSVDSLVEAVWTENDPTASSSILNEKRTSLRSEKSLALISPSVGRRLKSQRGVNELPLIHNNKSPDTEMEVASSFSLHTDLGRSIDHKSNKKEAKLFQQRLERLYKVNIHLHALFAAVENGYLERARTILESTDVDVNSLNNDGLSPLDVAVLSNNRSLVKMLFSFGAKENQRLSNSEKFGVHLKQLLNEAEVRLQELGGRLDEPYTNTRASFSSFIGNAYPSSSITGCAGSDSDKQAIAWNRRAKILKRLVLGFTQARPPDPPSLLALDVISETSVAIRLQEPTSADSSITTKFKVQWSTKKDFSVISGEKEIYDVNKPNCIINLTQGRKYFFRASCGNLKGHGNYTLSSPNHVVPSSWKEIDGKNQRFDGQLQQLNAIMNDIKQIRPDSDIFETPAPQRKIQRKKTTIKQLFTAASKFQKNLKRGIYLACILYHEDKVLVTNEDFLPVIEIDDTFPSCIHSDLHWFMKISSTWDFIKSLKSEMEKNASSAIHFRTKLIQAALQMQSSLSLQDLGQLYFKPIKDAQGTVVLSTVNYVKSPKSISVLNSRWLPINKLYKKMVISDDQNINDLVMASIQEQINYHQASSLKLNKGLYLSYLKMQSSMDLIQIVVPSKSPNMLPHCKIRDNPHVSAEEWEYLKQQHLPDLTNRATEQQKNFLDLVTSAGKRLFNYMDIRGEDALTHRIYDLEIIEINQEVSFIVICPPAEFSCSIPGQREILLQRGDLLSLPIQVFEMIHLSTYQSSIIRKYSKLSCLLELDTVAASHMHREAFSKSEVALTKERLIRLHDLQAKLNQIWKTIRWLVDVISFARDRVLCGISMRFILNKDIESTSQTSPKRNLLQIPSRDSKIVKSTPGRGSWPGPGSNSSTLTPQNSLVNEFSKSEQHLSINDSSSQYLSACSESESRKNSDSFIEGILNERLPSSKSEDMLFALPSSSSSTTNNHHRCRAKTVSSISATSSPLLSVQPLHGGSLISVNTTNTSGSVHSINSDNDNFQQQQPPISSSTPHKVIVKSKMTPSRSMTNVKNPFTDICQPLATTTTTTTTTDRYRRKLNIDFTSNLETTLSKSLSNIKSRTDTDLNYPKPVLFPTEPPPPPPPPPPVAASSSKTCDDILTKKLTTQSSLKDQSGILQVYAAYDTGLASGTSLKLHVTPRTTAKEVVDLVVKQLNMAVVLKGKDGPIYSSDKLKNFCLVTVIGARERCLRDDFKPLQLQNPWKKGRLYVRQKHDVLAALEHSSRHSAII